jgi:hypothetical protein
MEENNLNNLWSSEQSTFFLWTNKPAVCLRSSMQDHSFSLIVVGWEYLYFYCTICRSQDFFWITSFKRTWYPQKCLVDIRLKEQKKNGLARWSHSRPFLFQSVCMSNSCEKIFFQKNFNPFVITLTQVKSYYSCLFTLDTFFCIIEQRSS